MFTAHPDNVRRRTDDPDTAGLDVALVAGVRFDASEPHAGGLERHTDVLARHLGRLGHRVTVFAGTAPVQQPTDGSYTAEALSEEAIDLSSAARADVSMPAEAFMIEHHAYLELALVLQERAFHVVHNNSLHYLPVVWQSQHPTVHTLHTPPTPWLESAHQLARRRRIGMASTTVSVSRYNADSWGGLVDDVILNGVDLDELAFGSGEGGYAFWSGRLVPEKGAHLAIRAARRAGIPLLLAGPVHDQRYFDECIFPELDDDCVYLGHCGSKDISRYLAGAAVAVVTPRWSEPFGLVVAEAMACGTPVAAFERGAITELVDDSCGRRAVPDDVDALAVAIEAARRIDRYVVRAAAERRFSAAAMARRYADCYRRTMAAA